jgi:hypothetical protein
MMDVNFDFDRSRHGYDTIHDDPPSPCRCRPPSVFSRGGHIYGVSTTVYPNRHETNRGKGYYPCLEVRLIWQQCDACMLDDLVNIN